MKYVKIFENTSTIGNSEVEFSFKNKKLDELKERINAILIKNNKKIGYNYSSGSKGIYFTTNDGMLLNEMGYGCSTFSELLSNMEVILYTLNNLNLSGMSISEQPIEALPVEEPTNDIVPIKQVEIPIIDTDSIIKFTGFDFGSYPDDGTGGFRF